MHSKSVQSKATVILDLESVDLKDSFYAYMLSLQSMIEYSCCSFLVRLSQALQSTIPWFCCDLISQDMKLNESHISSFPDTAQMIISKKKKKHFAMYMWDIVFVRCLLPWGWGWASWACLMMGYVVKKGWNIIYMNYLLFLMSQRLPVQGILYQNFFYSS